MKSKQNRDATVQELLRRNKALEDELHRLRENMGVSMTSSPYSGPQGILTPSMPSRHSPVYDDNLSTGSGAIPSPRTSPFPNNDYNNAGRIPDYNTGYVPFPNNCETWAASVPTPTVPSNVSSPSSSHTDEYTSHYLPTSAPMIPSSSNLPTAEQVKMEYEDGNGMSHSTLETMNDRTERLIC